MPTTENHRPQREARHRTALVAAVLLAAGMALATLPPTDLVLRPGMLALLLGLGLVAGAVRIRLPGLRVHMAATDPFILCALGAIGPLAACVVALAAVGGAAVFPKRKPEPVRLMFNLGAVTLAVAAASWTFSALAGVPGGSPSSILAPLAGATLAYFIVTSSLVTAAVALETRNTFFRTWRRCFLWTPPAYLGSFSIAVAMLAVMETAGAWSLVVGISFGWLLVVFFRQHAVLRAGSSGMC